MRPLLLHAGYRLPVRPKAFTLTEVLIVVAIVGVLAGILIPVLAGVRKASQRATCASNLRQLGLAVLTYTTDNKGVLPWSYKDGRGAWCDQGTPPNTPPLTELLVPAGLTKADRMERMTVFKCPTVADLTTSTCSYTANCYVMGREVKGDATYPIRRLNTFSHPATTVLIAEKNVENGKENTKWFDDIYWKAADVLVDRHSGKENMLFLDGHVALLAIPSLTQAMIRGK